MALFTFGDTPARVYERMIQIVSEAGGLSRESRAAAGER
jgi:rhamnose utilization protein RhaD (predicted bifunctional aldolase and dehydrogenase)